jgi:integrase
LTGGWKNKTATANSINRAKKLRVEMQHEFKDGYTQPSKMTLKIYLDEWLRMKKSTWAESTYDLNSDNCRLRICPALGDIPLNQLRTQQIQVFVSKILESKLSKRTVIMTYLTPKQSLKYAVEQKYIPMNPMDSIPKPKDNKPIMRVLTEDEIKSILTEAKKTDYFAYFFTLIYTAMRRGEGLALHWRDIDLEEQTVSINRTIVCVKDAKNKNVIKFSEPKTEGSRRLVDLTPHNCEVLKLHREHQNEIRKFLAESENTNTDPEGTKKWPEVSDNDLVFCHPDNTSYNPHLLDHVWRKITKRCGITDVNLHSGTRHTHASILFNRGVPTKVIQEKLGHYSPNFTENVYIHHKRGMGKSAALIFDNAINGNLKTDETLKK